MSTDLRLTAVTLLLLTTAISLRFALIDDGSYFIALMILRKLFNNIFNEYPN